MTHRIFGWFLGKLYVKATGYDMERFVNLCRNHGIVLWGLSITEDREKMYFYISLRDFYRLRKIVRKSKTFLVVKRRTGFPFLIQFMKKHSSFFVGVACMFAILFFLSGRIWKIEVSGQSYHTRESMTKFLNKKGVYGGMSKSKVSCNKIKEWIRKEYRDIGWISVEEQGSFLHIRVKEMQMVEKEKAEETGHLVADADGRVVSIVTRKGTAKVKAGKKVKKGDVLISGVVKIKGDSDELIETDYVHAEGDVVLREEKSYKKELEKVYQKKEYTGRERKIYEWNLSGRKFFLYNPLNNLESYEKYDIIREGGVLCPDISVRFPVKYYTKLFREVRYVPKKYSKKEAEHILKGKYEDMLAKKREEGYVQISSSMNFKETEESFFYEGKIIFYKKQEKYRTFHKKTKKAGHE